MTTRDKEILELRDVDKLTYQEIGDKFNISAPRVRQIYERAKSKERFLSLYGLDPLYILCDSNIGTLRALYRAGIKTVNDLIEYKGKPRNISSDTLNILKEKAIKEN